MNQSKQRICLECLSLILARKAWSHCLGALIAAFFLLPSLLQAATGDVLDSDSSAPARADSHTYAVTMNAVHGNPSVTSNGVTSFGTGPHLFAWGTSLTASASTPATDGATRYVCSGWTATGSAPSSGTTGSTGCFSLTQNTSITWNWLTQYWLNINTSGNGSVNVIPGWKDAGSTLVVTATPNVGHHFVNWTGDMAGCTINGAQITVPMSQARTITANFAINITNVSFVQNPGTKGVTITYVVAGFDGQSTNLKVTAAGGAAAAPASLTGDTTVADISLGDNTITWDVGADWGKSLYNNIVLSVSYISPDDGSSCGTVSSVAGSVDTRDYTLEVVSAYGVPSPAVGTYSYNWGDTVNVSLASSAVAANGNEYRCSGWTGANVSPASGDTSPATITIGTTPASTSSTLTWNWDRTLGISNVSFSQIVGTRDILVNYDLYSNAERAVEISVTGLDGANEVAASAFATDSEVGLVAHPGGGQTITKTLVWKAGTDWGGNCSNDFKVTVSASEVANPPAPAYLVVDLSGGSSAVAYPVTKLFSVPFGGWKDEHKTTKMVLRRIERGTFTMGSATNELGRGGNEDQHVVTLGEGFYLGVFEVTQKQYELVMGSNPSAEKDDKYPVENVCYNDIRGAVAGAGWPANNNVDEASFMGKLRARTDLVFDLPTEAQWEYACRAGTTTALNSGKNLTNSYVCPNMAEVGRYLYSSPVSGVQAEVGSYLPNSWGLYDMHGNAREWCLDWYTYSLTTAYVVNPKGPNGPPPGYPPIRVVRGGHWFSRASDCRSASRNASDVDSLVDWGGFRVGSPFPVQ